MIGLESRDTLVPANAPWVTISWRAVRPRPARIVVRRPGTSWRKPDAAYKSERTTRSATNTNNQSRARNPALVSCSTSSGTRDVLRFLMCPTPAKAAGFQERLSLRPVDERRVANPDDVTVGQLPGLHRVSVDRSAVGRAQIRERGGVPVPVDLEVAAGDAGVRKPEVRLLAAADHRGAAVQLEAPVRPVVNGQRGARALLVTLVIALLAVTLVVVALLGVPLLVVALVVVALLLVPGLGVPLLGVALLVVPGLAVALLRVALLVVPGLAVALLGVALLVVPGLAVALLGVALLGVSGVVLLRVALLLVSGALLAARVVSGRLGVGLLAITARGAVVAVVAVLLRLSWWLAHRWFLCVALSRREPRNIGIHGRAGTELTRVQRLGALQ